MQPAANPGIGWRIGAALCAGALSGLAVVPAPLGWPGWLAWIALVPLLRALDGASGGLTVILAITYATLLGLSGIGPWLAGAVSAYFGLGAWPGAAYALSGLAVLSAVHGLLLGVLLLARPRCAGLPAVLWYGAAWVCWEAVRTFTFPYYPAAVLGLSQYQARPITQVASLCGVAGVTFVVVACNAGLASLPQAAWAGMRRHITAVFGGLGLAAGAVGWGVVRVATLTATLEPAGSDIAVVDADARDRTVSPVARYLAASHDAAAAGATLLIWPEGTLPADFERDQLLRRRLSDFVNAAGIPLIAGGTGSGAGFDAQRARFGPVHIVVPGGEMRSYHNRQRVPFEERLQLGRGSTPSVRRNMNAGRELPVFDIGGRRFGVLIGFEITDAGAARALARRGAQFIVNPANDTWFAGLAPHVPWAVLRAIETGLPVVRAANAGASLVIDRLGYIVATREHDDPALLASWVPVGRPTVYVQAGDVLVWACGVVVVVGFIGTGVAAWRRRAR